MHFYVSVHIKMLKWNTFQIYSEDCWYLQKGYYIIECRAKKKQNKNKKHLIVESMTCYHSGQWG